MSAPKWTPGPWHQWTETTDRATVDIRAGHQAWPLCTLRRKNGDVGPVAWMELCANARLIAAAPELYEALQRLMAASLRTDIDAQADAYRHAESVLAKARGEEVEP